MNTDKQLYIFNYEIKNPYLKQAIDTPLKGAIKGLMVSLVSGRPSIYVAACAANDVLQKGVDKIKVMSKNCFQSRSNEQASRARRIVGTLAVDVTGLLLHIGKFILIGGILEKIPGGTLTKTTGYYLLDNYAKGVFAGFLFPTSVEIAGLVINSLYSKPIGNRMFGGAEAQ